MDASSLRTVHAGDGTRPGTVRRWLVLGFLPLAFQAAAADSPYLRSVTVTREDASYVCEAVLFAPVPPLLAWEVLTDVDHMVGWVPNLRQSRVLRREGDVAIIEQVGLAQFAFLSFTFTTERRLELNRPVSISAVQIRGDARRYNSVLRLTPEATGTRLNYHAEFEPGLLASLVLSRDFFEHEIGEQFTAMIGEMVRRNERSLTPGPSPKGRGERADPKGEGNSISNVPRIQ